MRVSTDHSLAAFLGLAATLIMGCGDSTGPTATAIHAVVFTSGATIDRDPDGYTLSIDGEPPHVLDAFDEATFTDIRPGTHLLHLGGTASNCFVVGENPRPVDIAVGQRGSASITVSFVVQCVANTGSIHVSAATSGPDQDADGYTVILSDGLGGATIPTNGTRDFANVPRGQVAVALTDVAANCAVDGANPRAVDVPFAVSVAVTFTVQCTSAGSLQVTTTTTGTFLDPNGYELEIRGEGGSATRRSVSTNGTATFSGLLGDYVLTLLEIMPNCDVAMPNSRVVAINPGAGTAVNLDITCGAPREIAYVSVAGANADISIMGSNATGVRRITAHPSSDSDPAWSPNGSRLAFTSERDGNREIYVMNADGTNQVRLTNIQAPDFRPAWSPDGTRIAFASTRDGNTEIYVMNADGSNPVRLTSDVAYDADPAWSPDGNRIAFSSDREGTGGIWVMNANGSGLTRLTTNPRRDTQPAWSPDGSRIAFSRGTNNDTDIFIMNADGSGVAQLTHGIENAADPAWSPDGRKIALGSVPKDCGWYEYYCDPYIVVVSTDGIPYSSLMTFASNPAWRP